MANFDLYFDLYSHAIDFDNINSLEYFKDFFNDRNNLDAYLKQFILEENEELAIEILYSKDDLKTKVEKALKVDPYCFEALLVKSKYYEDEDELYDFYHNNYLMMLKAENQSQHAKENIILFVNVYADFLLDVNQSEDSLNVQKEIIHMLNELEANLVIRLFYTLDKLNKIDELINIYLEFVNIMIDPGVYLAFSEIFFREENYDNAKLVLFHLAHLYNDIVVDHMINQDIRRILETNPAFDEWVIDYFKKMEDLNND